MDRKTWSDYISVKNLIPSTVNDRIHQENCEIFYHQELLCQLDDKLEPNSEGTRIEDIGDTVVWLF